jgi:hypothetical protein
VLIALDPGPVESAFVMWDGATISQHGKWSNDRVINELRRGGYSARLQEEHPLYIEMIASYGMAVGKEVFETCVWIGRFMEAYGDAELVYRLDVKLHHCQSAKAKDSNIRAALIDRFGHPGTKKAPGLTYGLKADEWQAFALAVYANDKKEPHAV